MSVEPIFHFNMTQLTQLLKRQAEQNPSASYFNVDILKVSFIQISRFICNLHVIETFPFPTSAFGKNSFFFF